MYILAEDSQAKQKKILMIISYIILKVAVQNQKDVNSSRNGLDPYSCHWRPYARETTRD